MVFDNNGELIKINQPIVLTKSEKKELYSYLWVLQNIQDNKVKFYEALESQLNMVDEHVTKSLTEITGREYRSIKNDSISDAHKK